MMESLSKVERKALFKKLTTWISLNKDLDYIEIANKISIGRQAMTNYRTGRVIPKQFLFDKLYEIWPELIDIDFTQIGATDDLQHKMDVQMKRIEALAARVKELEEGRIVDPRIIELQKQIEKLSEIISNRDDIKE